MDIKIRNFLKLAGMFVAVSGAGCTQVNPDETVNSVAEWLADGSVDGHQLAPVAEMDAEEAYKEYLKRSKPGERNRQLALIALADIETKRGLANEALSADNDSSATNYLVHLSNAAEYLSTHTEEFPDARKADIVLYQLARLYERLGREEDVVRCIERLRLGYPESQHFGEANFRFAEIQFNANNFFDAEAAYSIVISGQSSTDLREKALIKRGWSRYKQGFYEEAIGDFGEAIIRRDFDNYEDLSQEDKSDFEEYFRALAIASQHVNDPDKLLLTVFSESKDLYPFYAISIIGKLSAAQLDHDNAADLYKSLSALSQDPKAKVLASLERIAVLKRDDRAEEFESALSDAYDEYRRNLSNLKKDEIFYRRATQSLSSHMLDFSRYSQGKGFKENLVEYLDKADYWYQQLVTQFPDYARKERVHHSLGEISVIRNQKGKAIDYFLASSFTDGHITDSASALAVGTLLYEQAETHKNTDAINKLADFLISTSLDSKNPRDFESLYVASLELAYAQSEFDCALDIIYATEKVGLGKATQDRIKYLESLMLIAKKDYAKAQPILIALLEQGVEVKDVSFALAQALYGEAKDDSLNAQDRAKKLATISTIVPSVELSMHALFEAISVSVESSNWIAAINYINHFREQYPDSTKLGDVTKYMYVVGQNIDDPTLASQAMTYVATNSGTGDVNRSAIWRSAELNESTKRFDEALSFYVQYAENYPTPIDGYIEAVNKIIQLNDIKGRTQSADDWRVRTLSKFTSIKEVNGNTRLKYLLARYSLDLAAKEKLKFEGVRLVEPLSVNLQRKRSHMDKALAHLGRAAAANDEELTVESTYMIGKVYQEFSRALLDSERPKGLSEGELEEYNMLLEDEAYPFEEMAIEFYETNMARTTEGVEGEWIAATLSALRELSPARYSRRGKIQVAEVRENVKQ